MGILDAPAIPLAQKGKAGGVAVAGNDGVRLTVDNNPPATPQLGDVWTDLDEAPGAVAPAATGASYLRADLVQTLTPTEQTRVLANLGAAPAANVAPLPSGGDDRAVLQALADAGGTVWLRPKATYKINGTTGLVIDPSKTKFKGDGTRINASGMTGGVAVTFAGTDSGFTSAAKAGFEGIELYGPGKTSSVIGMRFVGASSSGQNSEQFNLRDVGVHDFGTNLQFGSNAWAINFIGCSFWNATQIIDNSLITTNGGERLTFVGCTLFDSTVALSLTAAAGVFQFVACSFDFCPQLALVQGPAKVFLTDCHVEYTPNGLVPIVLTGSNALFSMHQGTWVQSIVGSPVKSLYIVDALGGSLGQLAEFRDVAMTGVQVTGAGSAFARGGAISSFCYMDPPIIDASVTAALPASRPGKTSFRGPVYLSTGTQTIDAAAVASGIINVNYSDTPLMEYNITTGLPFTFQVTPDAFPPAFRTQDFTYVIQNGSGGALGAITWPGILWAGKTWTNPAPGGRRHVVIRYFPNYAKWVAVEVAGADY